MSLFLKPFSNMWKTHCSFRWLALVPSLMAALSFGAVPVSAASPADPWADAVYNFSNSGVNNPENALGPPDGQTTDSAGVQKFITLDMGEGEEGTDALRVHFGQLLVQTDIQVTFLDAALNQITSQTRSLLIATGTHSEVFPYNYADFGKAYRYVRLTSLAEAGFSLDAVEALGYNKTPSSTTPPPAPSNCQSDTWSCSEWSYCSSNGQETRSCNMTSDCPGVATPSPALSRECIPPSSQPSSTSYPPSYPAPTYNAPTYYAPSQNNSAASAPTSAPTAKVSDTKVSTTPKTTSAGTGASSDVTPPTISGVQATGLDPTTEKITWQTNEPSDSGVEYGTEGGLQHFTPLDPTLTKEHSVWLTGLDPNTNYVFRVYSRDAAGNQARSPESRFTTLAGQVAAALAQTTISVPMLDACGWTNVLLSGLLILAVALAAHWHGQVVALQKRAQKASDRPRSG